MQRFLIAVLFLLGTALSGVAGAETSWWQADWKYRKPITINAADAGLTQGVGRTPVLVRLHAGNFAFDGVDPDGKDLRFIASDDRTVLNHQIEQFDPALGIALVWVDMPTLPAGAAQTIWMYYGNDNAPVTGNGQMVFDPDYVAVLHFADANGQVRDTTAYGNAPRNAPASVDGALIGRGVQLGEQPLVLASSPSLNVAAEGAMSFSAWVRVGQAGPNQILYSRRGGEHALLLGLDNGLPFVELNGQRAVGAEPLAAEQWKHLGLSAGNGQLLLFVDGREVARLTAALPAMEGDSTIGADTAQEGQSETSGNPLQAMVDEVRLSKVARPAALFLVDASTQGPQAKLLSFGEDEQSAGVSHFGFILKSMPVDAWVVVAVLLLMLLVSWSIMIAKSRYFGAVAKANTAFTDHYRSVAGQPVTRLGELARSGQIGSDVQDSSSLWRLYRIAMDELQGRLAHEGVARLSDTAIVAIRASLDAEVTRESERMSKRMNWLSTTIEGAPYVGLFGTVIGIMLVFAVAAMAGAVDINSVAPGMAAALLCTAAGLGVAIPALFGYNWLASRADAIAAEMTVFVDEFAARLAEESERGVIVPARATQA